MNQQLFEFILQIVSPIAVALAAWAMAEAARFVRAKVQNEQLSGALARATEAVSTAVSATTQTMVADLKARASDGKLTKDEAQQALTAALQRAKSGLGDGGLAAARSIIGTDEKALDAWLVDLIESRIASVKEGTIL